jgi:methylthioribose-1-phosphate isomerase
MRDLSTIGLQIEDDRLLLLDQTLLPDEERWLCCDDADTLIEQIRALRVRGAPMIAIASVLLLACRAHAGDDRPTLNNAIERLRASRPTAVNLSHAMNRLRDCLSEDDSGDDWRERVVAEAYAIFDQDRALCDAIADHGEPLIADGDRILTHCNTGGLATAGVGTALGVIRRAHERDKAISVWIGETRPLLQGARLTAWELGRLGILHHLIVDSAAGALMAAGEIDKVIVGADRIAANGDVANKIGTYNLAVLAHHHGIPFYVAAPHTTVDPNCPDGAGIPIEQRAPEELRGTADIPVHNPAFDVTPAELITAWVLDAGVYGGNEIGDAVIS